MEGLIYSDVFKPQGISASARIRFQNVPRNRRIGHQLNDVGSARMFNVVDWDGSWCDGNGHSFIGSAHDGDWWKVSDSCVKESYWNVWVCPRTMGREIAHIYLVAPGLIDEIPGFYAPTDVNKIGNMSLWGPGFPTSPSRQIVITRNPGVTGITNVGWHMWLHTGTPQTLQLYPFFVPNNGFVLFSTKYPTNTVFNIWLTHNSMGHSNVWRTLTRANTFDEVRLGNATNYFWDNTRGFLVLKLTMMLGPYDQPDAPNPSTKGFQRDDVMLWSSDVQPRYNIQADCPGAVNGLCPVSNELPTGYWTTW
jgi:hypothetical protein